MVGINGLEIYKYNNQPVRYFPFNSDPGAPFVLVSNPWLYLKAWIDQKLCRARGEHKQRLEKARYFADQAENFQIAADQVSLPIKATLAYYSLLNLAKVFLSVNGLDLEKKEEVHGITLINGEQLQINGKLKNCTNIFYEFCRYLGKPVVGKAVIPVDQVFSDIPEIHEIAFTLQKIASRKFLPVEIDFLTNSNRNKLYVQIKYKKEHEVRLPVSKFKVGERKKHLVLKNTDDNSWAVFHGIRPKGLKQKNFPLIYKNACKTINKFDVALLLTRDGYRYYVNLKPNSYHPLANTLLMLFYMGTVARYRPTLVREIMAGELYPIIAEIVETSPKQFLYQITNYITESVCAVPKAKI